MMLEGEIVQKKQVYDGYQEQYVTGKELTEFFKDCYLAVGRHHSDIVALSVPEYLYFLGIEDAVTYRFFHNQYFCRVMDGATDALIVFFGHYSFGGRELSEMGIREVHPRKKCPKCGSSMVFREGRGGAFLGCSNYPICKFTRNIPIIGHPN